MWRRKKRRNFYRAKLIDFFNQKINLFPEPFLDCPCSSVQRIFFNNVDESLFYHHRNENIYLQPTY